MSKRGKVALYRKYRPQNLNDIVGQPQVTDILSAAIKKQMIGHAYLFSGPRGTGKTSAARILAHEFNNIPYSPDLNLDIIEIDAASNRRIEDIRDLREVIKLAPTKLKYKIYIIDEVHMLTNESFNALLKTLEKPPAHAIFILATTDLHKVPATILSRTQKFNFRLLSFEQLAEHLANIASKEGIKIDAAALSLIAELAGGSVRDGISILDQLSVLGSDINEPFVREVMGMPSAKLNEGISRYIANFDSGSLLSLVDQMLETGSDPREIIKTLIKLSAAAPEITNLHLNFIDDLSSALNSYNPDLFLKIAILKFNPDIRQVELGEPEIIKPKLKLSNNSDVDKLKADNSNQTEQVELKPTEIEDDKLVESDKISPDDKPKLKLSSLPKAEPKSNSNSNSDSDAGSNSDSDADSNSDSDVKSEPRNNKFKLSSVDWVKILEEVKLSSAASFAALRLARAEAIDGVLNLTFKFDFHKKKLDEAKNKKILLVAASSVLGFEPELKYNINKQVDIGGLSLSNKTGSDSGQDGAPQESILSKVSNIMGGGEVLNQ